MVSTAISPELKAKLADFLLNQPAADVLTTFFYFLGERYKLHPVVFAQGKTIYKNVEDAIEKLEKENKLWRETQIRVTFSEDAVNSETKKIYICPFCGKAYGDNTHPNPQDAIYDHVGSCPENQERIGGLRVKRFHASEDPEVIKNYILPRKEAITKTVYSSAVTGKLFNSRRAAVDDFKNHLIRPIPLHEVQEQTRFQIEPTLQKAIEEQLTEERLSQFVEGLAEFPEFESYVSGWVEGEG